MPVITPAEMFTQTDVWCPKCTFTKVNIINGRQVCETCGWYEVPTPDPEPEYFKLDVKQAIAMNLTGNRIPPPPKRKGRPKGLTYKKTPKFHQF